MPKRHYRQPEFGCDGRVSDVRMNRTTEAWPAAGFVNVQLSLHSLFLEVHGLKYPIVECRRVVL